MARRLRMLPACRTAGEGFAIPTFDVTPRDVEGFREERWEFQSTFHDCCARSESRVHFFDYSGDMPSRGVCWLGVAVGRCPRGQTLVPARGLLYGRLCGAALAWRPGGSWFPHIEEAK